MKRSSLAVKQSLWPPSWWLRQLSISLLLSIQPIAAAYALGPAAALPGQLVLQDGKLTARLTATPLRQVMEEVSRLSGARVRWLSNQVEEKPVSAEFTALPLPEALRRIFGETNFLLFYASETENTALTQIWISAKGNGREQPGPAPQSATMEERQEESDATPVDTLIQTAVSTEDPSLRVEAIAQLGERTQEYPKVEGLLSYLASNDNNPQVRAAASEVLTGIERGSTREDQGENHTVQSGRH